MGLIKWCLSETLPQRARGREWRTERGRLLATDTFSPSGLKGVAKNDARCHPTP
ncbi:MAG: hypothetical protein IKU03_02815 [Bacteroidales bacterium]|nr:hypothetical protein [Bacteroidales bacterium]